MKKRKIVSTLLALLLLASLPVSAHAATWDIGKGDITVNAESGGQTVRQGGGAAIPDSAPVITGTSKENNVTINAEKDQTANVTLSGVNIDVRDKRKAAVSTTGEGNVSIELNGESTLRGGYEHAGLEKNNGGSLTIADEDKNGKLTAWGGQQGAGIGGGVDGKGEGITVSGNAQLKVRGGSVHGDYGTGAGIGGGGSYGTDGAEVEPDICELNPSGKIEYYAPGSDKTGTPSKTVANPTGDHVWNSGTVTKPATCTEKGVRTYTCTGSSHTKTEDIPALNHSFAGQEYVSDNNATCEQDGTKTAKCVRYDQCGETHTMPDEGSRLIAPPLYRVTDQDGKDIAHKAERKDGVLTVTVDADFAILTGKLSSIDTLKRQGIEKIVFVTNKAASTLICSP